MSHLPDDGLWGHLEHLGRRSLLLIGRAAALGVGSVGEGVAGGGELCGGHFVR